MQYFVLPVLLVIFSEILGTIVLEKYNLKKLKFNGLVGFCIILGIFYAINFAVAPLDVPFYILFIVTVIYFALLLFYVIKNFKYFKLEFNIIDIIFVLIILLTQLFFVTRSTIGSLWRYDIISYSQIITGSIYGSSINAIDASNGFGSFSSVDIFQAYCKLASVLYYSINVLCNKLHISFLYFTQHTWMYSTMLYVFISQLVVNLIDLLKIKSKWIYVLIYLFFIVYMGNFWWNSEQAYLGNSYRMIITSYCLLYLNEFFNTENNNYLLLFGLLNYANTALSDSQSILSVLLAFFVWLMCKDNKNTLKYLLLGIWLPMVNGLMHMKGMHFYLFIVVTVLFGVLCIFEEYIYNITSKIKLKKWLPIVIALLLIALSFNITHNVFDFNAFLNSWSKVMDMTWDYTNFSEFWRGLATISYLVLLAIGIITHWQNKVVKMVLIILVVVFNPFATAIEYKWMYNYYRCYDIVINYFTLALGFKGLEMIKLNKTLKICILSLLTLSFSYIGYKEVLYHPEGEGFDKPENYNNLLRMTNDEADAMFFMKDLISRENIKDGKVISSLFQFRTEFPYMKTLYNRGKGFNKIEKDSELYKIFYPDDYYGDPYGFKDADYEHIGDLLSESDYMFVIQGKDKIYYDEEKDLYYPLTNLINEYYIPIFDNDSLAIYRLDK